jgi:hypothetical protein
MARFKKMQYSSYLTLDGGVDQFHDARELKNNKLQSANNIHIDGGDLFKRPGKKPWGSVLAGPINGAYEYIDRDGTKRIFVAVSTDLYEVRVDGLALIKSGIGNERIHFTTNRGICFVNGDTTQFKVVGSTASDVGLAAPTTAILLDFGTSGSLTGSYAAKVTFVTDEGLESNPSPVSNSITLTGDKLEYYDIPVSTDSRVTKRKLYRTSAGGARYWYVATIEDNTTTIYIDNLSDNDLGDEAETTHGVPTQGTVSEGCNARHFWGDGSKLRWSEIAQSNNYLEYQQVLSFAEVPGKGKIVGLKALYNENFEKEDLYIFTEDSILILPQGDPNQAIDKISVGIGILSHDTITEYKNMIIFMDNENAVNLMKGRKILNISRRSIPTALKEAMSQENCSANVIFDHYYALTTRDQAGKLYNTKTWLCDLRTTFEVQLDQADAVWFPYEINAQYILQRSDSTVLFFSTNERQIYELNFSFKRDTEQNLTKTDWETKYRTKNYFGTTLMALKQPRMLANSGKFQKPFTVNLYTWSDDDSSDDTEFTVIGNTFLFGVNGFGTAGFTGFKNRIEAPLPCTAGNTFSFEYVSDEEDIYYSHSALQYTYKEIGLNL